jgi:hypothetical protein
MSWKTKDVSDLGISNGLAVSVCEKLKVKNCGDLAESLAGLGLGVIKTTYGNAAADVLMRELMNISRGEFDQIVSAHAPVDQSPGVDMQPQTPETITVKSETYQSNMKLEPVPPAAVAVTPAEPGGLGHVLAAGNVTPVENVGPEKVETGDVVEIVGEKKEGKTPVKKATKPKAEEGSGTVKLMATTLKPEADVDMMKTQTEALDRVLAQYEAVKKADDECDQCKEAAKDARKAKDKQRDLLIEMLRELRDARQPRLPGMSTLAAPAAEAATNEPPAEALTDKPGGVADWRRESVTVLMGDGLARGTLTKLSEAGIATMGDLQAAFLQNKVYTIDGLGKAKADKVRERAYEWLNQNRPKEDPDPRTEIRLLKDLVEGPPDNPRIICESGAVLPISMFGDGRVGCVHNGVTHSLTSDQWEPIVKPKMIQITKTIPGASADDKIEPGTELEVLRWEGAQAVVKVPKTKREVCIEPDCFEAL